MGHVRLGAELDGAQQILQGAAIKLQVPLCRLGGDLAAFVVAFIVDTFPSIEQTGFAWTARATLER